MSAVDHFIQAVASGPTLAEVLVDIRRMVSGRPGALPRDAYPPTRIVAPLRRITLRYAAGRCMDFALRVSQLSEGRLEVAALVGRGGNLAHAFLVPAGSPLVPGCQAIDVSGGSWSISELRHLHRAAGLGRLTAIGIDPTSALCGFPDGVDACDPEDVVAEIAVCLPHIEPYLRTDLRRPADLEEAAARIQAVIAANFLIVPTPSLGSDPEPTSLSDDPEEPNP